jgi:pimeloyl-ACP methyl ester carboxylesterase
MSIGLIRLSAFAALAVFTVTPNLVMAADGAAEQVNLATKDGVQLKATYYPGAAVKGSTQAKQTTPVVLLHDHKGNRGKFNQLVEKLQAAGEPGAERPYFAVMAVDLRAHGESTKQVSPAGGQVVLDPAKLSKEGLTAMATLDMEAIRSFLVDKNDAGELNLNKLCLVGSGMGASVATNWALADWTTPPLLNVKQGQDVKAVVLISPRWSYNGLSMQEPMRSSLLKQNVSWLLIYGAQDTKLKADFERIHKQLERSHPADKKAGAAAGTGLETSLVKSSLQGDGLLTANGISTTIDDDIVKFLTLNVATLQQPWTNRRNKLP